VVFASPLFFPGLGAVFSERHSARSVIDIRPFMVRPTKWRTEKGRAPTRWRPRRPQSGRDNFSEQSVSNKRARFPFHVRRTATGCVVSSPHPSLSHKEAVSATQRRSPATSRIPVCAFHRTGENGIQGVKVTPACQDPRGKTEVPFMSIFAMFDAFPSSGRHRLPGIDVRYMSKVLGEGPVFTRRLGVPGGLTPP